MQELLQLYCVPGAQRVFTIHTSSQGMQKGHMKIWRFELRSLNSQKGREKEWIFLFIDLQMKSNKTSPPPPKKKTNPPLCQ